MKFRVAVLTPLVLLSVGWLGLRAHPSVAHASCVPEEFAVVWSYPADGATNVPVDTDFFVLVSNRIRDPFVELDGEPIGYSGSGRSDLGQLQPETEYVVQVSHPGVSNPTPIEIRFTTGTSTAPTLSTPALSGYSVDTYPQPMSPQQCNAVLQAQDCYDAGEDGIVRFATTGEAAFWLVESTGPGADGGGQPVVGVWPGDCGPPSIVYRRERLGVDPSCVRLTSVSASGAHLSSNELCFDSPDSGKGCAVGPGGRTADAWPSVMVVAALFAVGLRRKEWWSR